MKKEYIFGFYYIVLAMITVRYNSLDRNLSGLIITMLITCGMFAYAINKTGIILNDWEKDEKELRETLNIINTYLAKKSIS